jgi:hypothetical protein
MLHYVCIVNVIGEDWRGMSELDFFLGLVHGGDALGAIGVRARPFRKARLE